MMPAPAIPSHTFNMRIYQMPCVCVDLDDLHSVSIVPTVKWEEGEFQRDEVGMMRLIHCRYLGFNPFVDWICRLNCTVLTFASTEVTDITNLSIA